MKIFENDPVWNAATEEWRAAKAAAIKAEKVLNAAVEKLKVMAPKGGQGNGLTLSRIISDGRISYKAALDELLPNADLEKWRGVGTTSYRVTDALKKESEE